MTNLISSVKNIKVIQVVGLYYPAPMYGTAFVARKVAERAYKSGFSSCVLTTDLYSFSPYKKLKETYKKFNGVSIERFHTLPLPKLYPYFPFDIFPKLSRLINGYHGIIHLHTYLDLGTSFAEMFNSFKMKCKVVLQPHFHPFPGGTTAGYLIRKIHDRTIGRFLVRSADSVIVMSEIEKNAMCALGADREKINRIPHGIEPVGVKKNEIKKFKIKYGITDKDKVIICVSRISSEIVKFFVYLINQIGENYVAVLVGALTSNLTHKAKNLIPDHLRKRLILTGFLPRETLSAVYLIGDYFVKPTNYEAFGIAFLEAMSAGLPILSYKVGALPEVIDEGENGFLFKIGEVNKIAQKIKELSINKKLYNKISENNREKAKKYQWDKVLDRYMEIYEKLARELTGHK